jgi:hypothetical protein
VTKKQTIEKSSANHQISPVRLQKTIESPSPLWEQESPSPKYASDSCRRELKGNWNVACRIWKLTASEVSTMRFLHELTRKIVDSLQSDQGNIVATKANKHKSWLTRFDLPHSENRNRSEQGQCTVRNWGCVGQSLASTQGWLGSWLISLRIKMLLESTKTDVGGDNGGKQFWRMSTHHVAYCGDLPHGMQTMDNAMAVCIRLPLRAKR